MIKLERVLGIVNVSAPVIPAKFEKVRRGIGGVSISEGLISRICSAGIPNATPAGDPDGLSAAALLIVRSDGLLIRGFLQVSLSGRTIGLVSCVIVWVTVISSFSDCCGSEPVALFTRPNGSLNACGSPCLIGSVEFPAPIALLLLLLQSGSRI